MNYLQKYIKYKNKYLILKNNLKGGNLYITNDDIKYINRFKTETDIEIFLNPIYGLYMYESGFISNIFFLNKANLLDVIIFKNEDEKKHIIDTAKIINKIYNNNGLNIPTNDIYISDIEKDGKIRTKYTPYAIGSYIALLFLHIKKKDLKSNDKLPFKKIKQDVEKISDNIKLGNINVEHFYLILFCLWCKMTNIDSLNEYYNGIKAVFDIYGPEYNIFINDKNLIDRPFENDMIKYFSSDSFNIFNYGKTKSFCDSLMYPDCGETTIRNLINLICLKDNKFNQNILEQLGAIDQIKEYYKIFYDLNRQNSKNQYDCKEIFKDNENNNLSSQEAWSKIIIFYANENINFNSTCTKDDKINYNVKSGLSKNNSIPNFLQLMKNLLREINLEDQKILQNNNILISLDLDNDGFGKIDIKKNNDDYIIYLNNGHFHMKKIDNMKNNNIMLYNNYNKFIFDVLKPNNYHGNFFYYNYNYLSEELNNIIHSNTNENNSLNLLLLSTTNKFNTNDRRLISINIKYNLHINFINKLLNKNKNILNDYFYISDNFDFITIYDIQPINFKINCLNKEIDLSPLKNYTFISDNFLFGCNNLEKIDLSSLKNLKSIGKGFLFECNNLEEIDLSSLENLEFIDDEFLANCKKLKKINSLNFSQLEYINDNFLANCDNLEEIDLSSLKNLKSIGNNFLANCSNLTKVILPQSINLISIGNNFLNNCEKLKKIDLSQFINLKDIGYRFLAECGDLEEIILPSLKNLISIGNNFMIDCVKLKKINLLNLSQLEYIGNNFLIGCNDLEEIDLSSLKNLKSIGDGFLSECSNLKKIDLSSLKNLEIIGGGFLAFCSNLTEIDLSYLINLKNISNGFLSECNNLKKINLSLLKNLEIIGNNFLAGCSNLTEIILPQNINLISIGNNFMIDCVKLKKINLLNLSQLEIIGGGFLAGCDNLEEINLLSLKNLKSIGDSFLFNCSNLEKINLSLLENLEIIDEDFLSGCSNLTEIDLSSLKNLKSIGEGFLFECNNLKKIILSKLINTGIKNHINNELENKINIIYI